MAVAGGGIQLKFSVAGDEATLAAFKALPLAVQKKVLRPALRAGAKIIHRQWRANVRSRSGATVASLKVRAGKRSRRFPDRVTVNVITSKGWFKGKDFWVAAVELGFKAGSRKAYDFGGGEVHKLGFRWIRQRIPVKARHWGKKAKESTHAAAQAAIHREIKAGIEREAKALAK